MPSSDQCILCGARSFRFVFAPPGVCARALERCTACSLLQMKPMPTDAELADYYQRYDVMGEREPYYAASWGPEALDTPEGRDVRARFAWVRTHLGDPRRVLDVGSGPGLFLRLVRAAGGAPVGVELNARAAERSAREFDVPVLAGTLHDESTLFRDAFGAITLWDLLEHVNDPAALVGRAHALLAPRGWLFIETPDESSLLDRTIGALARVGVTFPANAFYGMHHLALFRPATIRRLLAEGGFEVVEIRGAGTTVSRVFRGSGAGQWALRAVLNVLFFCAKMLGKENKMLIAARKR